MQCAETSVSAGFCRVFDETKGEEPCPPSPDCTVGSVAEDLTGAGCVDACSLVDPAPPVDNMPPPFYPNWTVGTCIADGEEPAWQSQLYDVATDCCRTHFNWKYDACITDAGPAGTNNAAADGPAEADAIDESAADPVDAFEPAADDEEADPTAGLEDTEESGLEGADEAEDEEELVDVRGDLSTCPVGWDYHEIDCSYRGWQNSQAWLCGQTFAPSTTDGCGEHADDAEFCLVPDAETDAGFGLGAGVAGSQKHCLNPEFEDDTCESPIFCGRGMICGCAD